MQVKALEGMLKQQEAVRQGIAGTVGTEDVEAATIARSYSGFKGEFQQMQEQIKKGDYRGIDAWCNTLGAGGVNFKRKRLNDTRKVNPWKNQ